MEVDEFQHRSRDSDCELARTLNICQDFGGLPVCFIRYNPDGYKDKEGKKGIISTSKRQEILIKWAKKGIREKIEGCKVKYLFYDNYEESDGKYIELTEKDVL